MRLPALFFLMIFCTCTSSAFGSFEHRGPDARVEGMGGVGVALDNPPFGSFYNPASDAPGNVRAIGISYALPFGNSSLDSFYGTLQTGSLPFDRNGSAGISWQHYGSSLYSETCTYATYSTKVAGPVRAGISGGFLEKDSSEKGSESTLGINLGVLAAVSPYLNIGASIFNLNRPETGKKQENAPSTTFAGMAYKPADNIVVSTVIEKQEKQDARLRTGGEVRVLNFLNLRAGFATNPSTFTGGAGFIFGNFRGDIGLVRHPELGTGSWYTMRALF